MKKREQELQQQLDDAKQRIAALEQCAPAVEVTVEINQPKVGGVERWWYGDGGREGARVRSMQNHY